MEVRWSSSILLALMVTILVCQPFTITRAAQQEEEVNAVSSSQGGEENLEASVLSDREIDGPVVRHEDGGIDKAVFKDSGQELGAKDGQFLEEGGSDAETSFPEGVEGAEGFPGGGEAFPRGEEEEHDDDDSEGGEMFEQAMNRNFSEWDVVQLTAENFEASLKQNKYILLLFYSEAGRASTMFRPYFAKAATMLKEHKSSAILAKMDINEGSQIAAELGVDSDPALVWYDHGEAKQYTGSVTSEDIAQWVRKKSEPMMTTISTKEEMLRFLEKHPESVIGFFQKLKGKAWKNFCEFARDDDSLTYGQTTSVEAAHAANMTSEAPALVVVKTEDEKWVLFDGKFEYDDLYNFLLANRMPLVSTYNSETADKVFLSPIQRQVLLFVPRERANVYIPIFKEACKLLKGDVLCVRVDSDDRESEHVLKYFEVSRSKVKIFGYIAGGAGSKVAFDDEMTVEKIMAFGKNLTEARPAPVYYKSSQVPENNDGDVTVVVGETFDEIVLDETKDVLLEAYAPWCPHCKDFEPLYNKLGAFFRNVPSVVIAKIDAIDNEHPRLQPLGYPSLFFFKAGQKAKAPVIFQGERTMDALIAFVEREASTPFTFPTELTDQTGKHRELASEEQSSVCGTNAASCGADNSDAGVCQAPPEDAQKV